MMRQLDFTAAFAARDIALASVESNAGPSFVDRACDFVTAYLRQHGPTPGEVLTLACRDAGIVPANTDKAFGAVYARLSRQGIISRYAECRRARGHGTGGGSIWRLSDV